MDRVNGADWIDIGGGRRGFRGRDALAGLRGTEVTSDWLNAVQESVLGVVEATGLTPDDNDDTQFLKAIRSGTLNYAVAGGTDTAYTAELTPALAAHVKGMRVTVEVTRANTGATALDMGPGPLPIKSIKGADVVLGDFPVGSFPQFVCTGTAWMVSGLLYSEVPIKPAGNLTLYVRTDGNDLNGDGSANTAAKAFASVAGAINYINRVYSGPGSVATIRVAPGTYGRIQVPRTSMQVVVEGDLVTPANVFISGADTPTGVGTISTGGGANITFRGLRIASPNAGTYGLVSDSNSSCSLQNCEWGNSPIASIVAIRGAVISMSGQHTFYGGNHEACLIASNGGQIFSDAAIPPTITLTAAMNYSNAWAYATQMGQITLTTATFVNPSNAVGKRFTIDTLSLVQTGGRGVNALPGSAAGTTSGNGVYA